mgnify:CR=1 FL=1
MDNDKYFLGIIEETNGDREYSFHTSYAARDMKARFTGSLMQRRTLRKGFITSMELKYMRVIYGKSLK